MASLAAILTGSISGVLGQIVPSPSELSCAIKAPFETHAAAEDFAIIVPRFEGDPSDTFGRSLAASIRRGVSTTVLRTCKTVPVSNRGNGQVAEDQAHALARSLLSSRRGKAIVWGEITPEGKHFRVRASAPDDLTRHRVNGELVSQESIDDFVNGQAFAVMLISAAVADGSPHIGDTVEQMKHRLSRLEAFAQSDALGDTWKPKTSFVHAQLCATRGSLLAEMARQSGVSDYSRVALSSFDEAFDYVHLHPDFDELPTGYSPEIRHWQTIYGHTLVIDTQVSKNPVHAQMAIDLWDARSKSTQLSADYEFDPRLEEARAQAYEALYELKSDSQTLSKAIQLYWSALEGFKADGYVFAGNHRCGEVKHWGDPDQRIEDTPTYHRLSELGFHPEVKLASCSNQGALRPIS